MTTPLRRPEDVDAALRPKALDEFVGQQAARENLRVFIDAARGRGDVLDHVLFFGPPGLGKTTLAQIVAREMGVGFRATSGPVIAKSGDLAALLTNLEDGDVLFIDEIHRLNPAVEEVLYPAMEDRALDLMIGEGPSARSVRIDLPRFTLVGATTENPSFELNAALLSRAQVLILHRLGAAALDELLSRSEAMEGRPLPLDDAARAALVASADGDGRFLLNQAETLFSIRLPEPLDPAGLSTLLQRRVAVYDKDREGHYNLISALHKSLRGSDPQAALYYMARMLTAGEEPLYVLRRLTRFASEDIGLADPQALVQCLAARDAYEFLGSPEGELAIVQACLYLATAPKSNAAYMAQKAAFRTARETGSLMPPPSILNAPTRLMQDIGYGKGYAYDHDQADGFSGANYWPEEMTAQRFYEPTGRGFEQRIAERMAWWDERRQTS